MNKLLRARHRPSFEVMGAVLAVLGVMPVTWASDIKTVIVEKGVQYNQTGTGTPIPDDNNGVAFSADVKATSDQAVTNATFNLPNGASDILPQSASDEFQFKKKYNKQSSLDSNFPSGAYTVTVYAARDGVRSYTLALTGDTYPSVPRVANFDASQAVDAGAFFRCTWDPFQNGSTNDFVQLHLDDSQGNKVWETPDIGESGALDGRATAALIPTHTLDPAQTYQATLFFGKFTARDQTTDPGGLGAALYYRRTKFPLVTAVASNRSVVKFYSVIKTRRYDQPDSGVPVAASTKPFTFDVLVDEATTNAVKSVTLGLPSGAPQDLAAADDKSFSFTADAPLEGALDATYSDGQYTFQITPATGNGLAPVLNLSGNAYPDAPQVQNLPATVNSTNDLQLTWTPWAAGTSDDFAQLHIDDANGDKVFETPDYGKSGAYDGRAVRATIPRNTLLPGQSYTGRVIFQRNVALDTTSYPGALGIAGYAARTNFKLVTAAGSQTAPHISQPNVGSTGMQFHVDGQPGQSLRVESSPDLTQWTLLQSSTVPSSGTVTVTDATGPAGGRRFYRATVAP